MPVLTTRKPQDERDAKQHYHLHGEPRRDRRVSLLSWILLFIKLARSLNDGHGSQLRAGPHALDGKQALFTSSILCAVHHPVLTGTPDWQKFVWPETLVWLAFHNTLSKVYANSMLAT